MSSQPMLNAPELQQALAEVTQVLRAPIYSRLLTLGFYSGLFALARNSRCSQQDLLAELTWQGEAGEIVLTAMTRCGYLLEENGSLTCAPFIAALLASGSFFESTLRDWSYCHDDLALLDGLLQGGSLEACKLFRKWNYKNTSQIQEMSAETVRQYSDDMNASSRFHSGMALDRMNLSGVKCLIDVGGGFGEFAAQVAERHPAIETAVFDLPQVRAGFEEKRASRSCGGASALLRGEFPQGSHPGLGWGDHA